MGERYFENYGLVNINSLKKVKLQLVCFHYAGGSSLIFKKWNHFFPEEIELIPVELPGHGSRINEQTIDSLELLVDNIASTLRQLLKGPYAIFGISMGALIGFELIRYMRRSYFPLPLHFYVAAHTAPHLNRHYENLHDLPEQKFIEKVRELNGTPKEVFEHPELKEIFLPILRTDFKVCETYVYRTEMPMSCPITVYGGKQDKDVDREELGEWEKHTSSFFKLKLFDGNHFFIHSEEQIFLKTFLDDLKGYIL